MQRTLVADLHIHPTLKQSLFNLDFRRIYPTSKRMIPFTMRTSLPRLQAGGVNLALSSIYIPEKQMLRDCLPLRILSPLLSRFRKLIHSTPNKQAIAVMNRFEEVVEQIPGVEIAKSRKEMKDSLNRGSITLLHSIEGGHVLGGRIENVDRFFQRGVCLITLAHFYRNEAVSPVEGIPHDLWLKRIGCFKEPKDLTQGLSEFGKEVVEKMLDLGILLDLTHSTPQARREIYELCGKRRPLLFTHVGVSELADYPMNPTDEEIRKIADTGGVIGVIFMGYWLSKTNPRGGVDLAIDTMKHLLKVGGIDCIGIGSDLDGFTNPLNNLKNASQMPRLNQSLLQSGFSETEIEKILGGNVLRVIEEGWGQA